MNNITKPFVLMLSFDSERYGRVEIEHGCMGTAYPLVDFANETAKLFMEAASIHNPNHDLSYTGEFHVFPGIIRLTNWDTPTGIQGAVAQVVKRVNQA